MTRPRRESLGSLLPRVFAELVLAFIGATLVAWAAIANQQWFDQHFLPAFFVSRQTYVAIESIGRVAAAVIGVLVLFVVRPRLGRFVGRNPLLVVNAIGAVVLAFAASEWILGQL